MVAFRLQSVLLTLIQTSPKPFINLGEVEVISTSYSVRHSPGIKPLHVAVVQVWANHSPTNGHEVDVKTNRSTIEDTIDGVLNGLDLVPQRPVHDEAEGQDGKVESWVVVMDVGDTCHGDKRQVVKEPSENWIERSVVDLVDINLLELVIAALPSNEVPKNHQCHNAERGSGHPVDQGVAKEEVFDDRVIPAAHTETNIKDGPLPELRGKIILLVWIRDECVIRSHHGHVQMNKILQERRLVGSSIGGRY